MAVVVAVVAVAMTFAAVLIQFLAITAPFLTVLADLLPVAVHFTTILPDFLPGCALANVLTHFALILATAMLIFFFYTGIGRGLHAMLLAHVALSLPYVIVIVGARLQSFGAGLEEAAATLGANPWQVFFRVTLPVIAPGVAAAALFAFGISFDQFVTSYFLSPPGVNTLPVEIYASIRKGFTPEINAVSSIIIVVSMGLMLAVARNYRFGGE